MRALAFAAVVALAAGGCKPAGKPRPGLVAQVPAVAGDHVLGDDAPVPAMVLVMAADGSLTLVEPPAATAATTGAWTRLGAQPAPRGRAVEVDALQPKPMDAPPPPPPPPEEELDDGSEESGGTGVLVNLDEAKLAQPDAARPDRETEVRRVLTATLDPALPTRARRVTGRVVAADARPARALLVAAPTARAAALIDAADAAGSSLVGVAHQGALRALRVGFRPSIDTGSDRWLEVRIAAGGLEVEAVPGPVEVVPWGPGGLDAPALADAYRRVRPRLGDDRRLDVDVLVAADTTVQRALDVVVALDGAGALEVSLGLAPAAGSVEAGKRGARIASMRVGQPQANGDLDKASIRRHVLAVVPAVKACYVKAVAGNPDLAGTVLTQFFISPDGKVASAEARGVDPKVAACVADVIKSIPFPKPKGGGGVQVDYPFTFRY